MFLLTFGISAKQIKKDSVCFDIFFKPTFIEEAIPLGKSLLNVCTPPLTSKICHELQNSQQLKQPAAPHPCPVM